MAVRMWKPPDDAPSANGARVGVVCATPHFYAEKNLTGSVLWREERLHSNSWKPPGKAKCPGPLLGDRDCFLSESAVAPELERLCIQGTRTLLLELPFMEWSQFQMEEASRVDAGSRISG